MLARNALLAQPSKENIEPRLWLHALSGVVTLVPNTRNTKSHPLGGYCISGGAAGNYTPVHEITRYPSTSLVSLKIHLIAKKKDKTLTDAYPE